MEYRAAPEQELRVSHEERNHAVGRLKFAYAEGRFDADELEQRLERAMTARTRRDIDDALRHLPVSGNGRRFDVEPSSAQDRLTAPTTATTGQRFGAAVTHMLGWPTLMIGPALVLVVAQSSYVRQHAAEAVNFQITFLAAAIGLGLLTAMTLGIAAIGFPFLIVLWMGLTGIGGLAALAGNSFHYPWTLRLLTP